LERTLFDFNFALWYWISFDWIGNHKVLIEKWLQ
jgi:hypothetical protein